MANNFILKLDTTGPTSPTFTINGGAADTTDQIVNANISVSDAVTTGFQIKIWGDVDAAFNVNIQATEGASAWITYSTSQQVKLSAIDSLKTLSLKIRDEVYNESSLLSDTITLDTTLPAVTITGPDVPKISKITGKNIASFSFMADTVFVEYKVKVVGATGSAENTGVTVGVANGSTNMAATGSFPANTGINCTITGLDLGVAGGADGDKIIKIFVKDAAGLWSV